jgi:lipoate---protein ligase
VEDAPMNENLLNCPVRDDGLREAWEQVVLDDALCAAGVGLRFHRYPTSGSLGAHERAAIALRTDYCEEQGIPILRRRTGGGALYLDPSQLCWSLVLPTRLLGSVGLKEILERHGLALVAALARLGIVGRFVFPNDIEVQGRKLGSGFATRFDDRVLIQGSLLVSSPDAEAMLKILRVPTEKLSHEGVLSARQRLISIEEAVAVAPGVDRIRDALAETLAEAFDLHPVPASAVSTPCAASTSVVMDDDASSEAMKAFVRTDGGTVYLALETLPDGRVARAGFSGAVQFSPVDLFTRLGQALAGRPPEACAAALERAFQGIASADLLGFGLADLQRLLALVLARREQADLFGMDRDQSNTLIVHNPNGEQAAEILEHATVMLVPYCAKLADCKFRFRDGCSECGMCEVGDAYRLARERGMRVVSITNFEHLQETLARMSAEDVPAYVGMCCESFYLKRHYAFQQAGIPAVLTDISGATCYELREEDLAYPGRFRAEAHLRLDVVEKVMRFVPPQDMPANAAAPGD